MMQTKHNKYLLAISIILVLAAISDYVTFMIGHKFTIFEINPIYIWLKATWLLLVIKIISVVSCIWFLYHPRKVNKILYYTILLSTIYSIIFQGLGAYSNLKIQADKPAESQALAPETAVKTYFAISLLYYLLPIVISTFTVWIYSKVYLIS